MSQKSILSSLPFHSLIYLPLNACAMAQMKLSQSTVTFIQDVGFHKDSDGNVRPNNMEFVLDTTINGEAFKKKFSMIIVVNFMFLRHSNFFYTSLN